MIQSMGLLLAGDEGFDSRSHAGLGLHGLVASGLAEGLLESLVRGSPDLEQVEIHEGLLQLLELLVEDSGEDWVAGTQQVPAALLATIIVLNPAGLGLAQNQWGLSQPIVVSIQWETLGSSLEVVSDNVNLVEASIETLGGWDVVHISQPEDVLILLVLQSLLVDVQESSTLGCGESISDQFLLPLSWDQTIHLSEWSVGLLSSLDILEHSDLIVLVHLSQLQAILHWYSSLLQLVLDELISSWAVSAEGIVGVDDSEVNILLEQLAVELSPVEDLLGEEEVEALDFSMIRGRGDVEDVCSSLVVQVGLEGLADTVSPGGVVRGDIEGEFGISPCLVKSLDGLCGEGHA